MASSSWAKVYSLCREHNNSCTLYVQGKLSRGFRTWVLSGSNNYTAVWIKCAQRQSDPMLQIVSWRLAEKKGVPIETKNDKRHLFCRITITTFCGSLWLTTWELNYTSSHLGWAELKRNASQSGISCYKKLLFCINSAPGAHSKYLLWLWQSNNASPVSLLECILLQHLSTKSCHVFVPYLGRRSKRLIMLLGSSVVLWEL